MNTKTVFVLMATKNSIHILKGKEKHWHHEQQQRTGASRPAGGGWFAVCREEFGEVHEAVHKTHPKDHETEG